MASSEWNPWNYRDDQPQWRPKAGMSSDSRFMPPMATSGRSTRPPRKWTRVHIVVDTGPWIFGRKVILPAGIIERIDWEDEKVYVDRSKDEIKASPELEGPATDPVYDQLSVYYGNRYSGR